MFSLGSNSIESRLRSIRWGNFLVNLVVTLTKSKSNYEFASLICSFFLATLGLDSVFCM